jgi:N-acetylneuraminate synthase
MIFVIAEIGINHNGDLNIAKQLMDISKRCGCDAVKFQKRTIEKVYTKELLDSPRESPFGKTQREQKQALEFNYDQYQEIASYAKKIGIEWFASAWDLDSQLFLRQFNLKYNKIASAMIVDKIFLKKVAEEKKHTFISTGMSTIEMISEAVSIFKNHNCSFELMHCNSTYPMKIEDANLNVINTLRNTFGCNVGYSGHESGVGLSQVACGMGITSLERHITLDRSMYGSDQSSSLEEAGLKLVVGAARISEKAFGDGKKFFTEAEKKIAEKLRAHIKI